MSLHLFGHPIHPMLIHFPLALWMLAVPVDLLGRGTGVAAAVWAVPWLLSAGCVLALPAMLTGLLDFAQLGETPAVIRTAYLHLGAMSLAWLLFASSLLVRWEGPGWQFAAGWVDLTLSLGGLIALSLGAWLGGELVYRHGVGVNQAASEDPEGPSG